MGIIKLYIEPTFKCNLKCKFCYVGDMQNVALSQAYMLDSGTQQEIETYLGENIFIEGENFVYDIDFLGGEPTINKKLLPIISYITTHYTTRRVTLTSNATLYTLENIGELHRSGITEFRVSLHGLEDTHNFLVQAPVFRKVIQSLEYFKELHIPYTLIYVVNNKNYSEILGLFEYLDTRGLLPRAVFFEFVEFSGFAHQHEEDLKLEYSGENVAKLNDIFEIFKKKYYTIDIAITNYPKCILPLKYHNTIDDATSTLHSYELYLQGGVRKSLFGFSQQEQKDIIKQNLKLGYKINFQQKLSEEYIPEGCFSCIYKDSCYLLTKETILFEYLGKEFLKRKHYFEIFKKRQPGK